MSETAKKQCPSCGYLRHPSDRAAADVCPWCNAIYSKASAAADKQKRRRLDQYYRNFLRNRCANCGESFSVLAKVCPYCQRAKSRKYHQAFAVIALLGVTIAAVYRFEKPVTHSPFSRLSDRQYVRCLDLSRRLLAARSNLAEDSHEYYDRQNEWHAECSRAALRNLHKGSPIPVPSTPEGWLESINNFSTE